MQGLMAMAHARPLRESTPTQGLRPMEAARILAMHPETLLRKIRALPVDQRPLSPGGKRPLYWWRDEAHVETWANETIMARPKAKAARGRKRQRRSTKEQGPVDWSKAARGQE